MADSEPIIDVDALMREVRERVATKRAAGLYGEDPASLSLDSELPIDRLAHRATVTGHRDRLNTGPRLLVPILTPVRRLILRSISSFLVDILQQINHFQADAARVLEAHEERLAELEARRASEPPAGTQRAPTP